MNSGKDSALTLNDIRNCMRNYCSSLVYQQDSLFYQATSQPKWMRAFLSHAIIGCMTQNSGEFENSEASNFIRKNIGAEYHNIDNKLRNLYEELIKDDCRAIAEEEAHLRIALSRCAYVLALNDSQIWGPSKQGLKISDRYKDNLSGITSLSPEGEQLSNRIKSSLIASIGLKIGRQCLPYYYTSDDIKESNLPKILESIDGVRLLTATILIAINYQNNNLERRPNDKEVDALTKRIYQFLFSKPAGVHNKSTTITENVYSLLTLGTIFNGTAYRKIVATLNTENRKLNVSFLNDIEHNNILTFLGLDNDIFDSSSVNIEKLVTENYCDSADTLKSFFDKCANILESVWKHLVDEIETNLSYTFSASSYFEETQKMPTQYSDLTPYSIPTHTVRWDNALEQACSSVKNIIQSTRVGVDFFMNCKKEVSADSIIEYIATLVLISFCYCKTPTNSEVETAIKTRYRKVLLEFVRKKFDYNSSDNNGSAMSALREGIQDLLNLRDQLWSEGQYAYASVIDKFYNELKLSHNDENSLIPPSRNR